ncbi:MAG: RNA polymerase sigma factor RpoD/SigA [Treponema sp.]|jgi:RNA polymerase primary sigma factor|nr:RNA polymerase sigma factor RpoD/SigA [Treponema sp.]
MEKKAYKFGDELLETYFKQIKGFPLLTFEEELILSKQVQDGNIRALHKLINSNLRLVVKIAGVFKSQGIPLMDMIQEGNLGLIHAAEKYDYRKNVRFCTYASWWIRQFISRYISNKRRVVRLPLRKEEALRKIHRTYNVLCQTLMHQPNNADIAEELGISVQDVDFIINLTSGPLSLEPASKDDESGGSMDVHEDYTYSPERNLLKQFSRDGTLRVLNKLKEREKRILNYRYQLNGCERYTLREIGDKLDISPETVRQIELRALKKIRKHVNELKECVYVEAI